MKAPRRTQGQLLPPWVDEMWQERSKSNRDEEIWSFPCYRLHHVPVKRGGAPGWGRTSIGPVTVQPLRRRCRYRCVWRDRKSLESPPGLPALTGGRGHHRPLVGPGEWGDLPNGLLSEAVVQWGAAVSSPRTGLSRLRNRSLRQDDLRGFKPALYVLSYCSVK